MSVSAFPYGIMGPLVPVEINEDGDFDVTRTVSGGPSYAGIRLNGNGTADGNNANGADSFTTAVAVDPWLDAGNPSGVYVERTISFGTADWLDDIGASRVALSTNPRIGCTRPNTVGSDTLVVTFNFYDAPSGGTLLGTITDVQLNAAISP